MPATIHIDANRDWGGGQVQSLGLALALAARGEETVFWAQAGSELAARLKSAYLAWEELPLRGLAGLRAVPKLAARLTGLKADLVHIHDSASHAVAGLAARLAGGPKIVVTRRTERPLRKGLLGRAQYGLWCDRLICISEAIRQRCLAAGLPDSLLTVIPDFVDCRHFDPAALQERQRGREKMIVIVGRLTSSKGHRVLLRAMGKVVRAVPEARLLVCGKGEDESALRAGAAGLGQHVSFAGFVPDVRAILAQADVFVMPSLSEGLGVAVLEAMAMGKPVVVSNAGGLPESVVHGETGLVVPAGDASALAEALASVLSDPERATRMGASGRERALRNFDRPRIVERILAVYEDVLGRGGT